MSKINFDKVKIKNFLSIGNGGLEFKYNKGIHAVTGHVEPSMKRNGAGKTTILSDAITFALFGKLLRKINKDEIVNTVNKKGCVVELIIKHGNDDIIVERGVKPTYLRIWENGEEIRYDSMKNTQSWLENKLKINFTCFSNIIVLNVNHSRPFLEMEAKSKREVIEDILSLKVYSRMSEEAKERHLEAKTNLKMYNSELEYTSNTLKEAIRNKKNIENEKKKFENEKSKKIKLLKSELNKLSKSLEKLERSVSSDNFEEKLDKFNNCINQKEKDRNNLTNNINLLKKDLNTHKEALEALEKQPYCPTCKTPTDNPIIVDFLQKTKDAIQEYSESLEKTFQEKEDLNSRLSKAKEKRDEILNKLEHRKQKLFEIDKIKHKIDVQTNVLNEEEVRELNLGNIISDDKLEEFKTSYLNAKQNFEVTSKQFSYNKFLRNVLGEDGVRKYVMSKILPFLNQKVNHYLQLLGSEYNISFDSNLDETIIARNREIRSYGSFSSGEKKRIDLSILLSLMDVAKMQNSVDTNILILDEVIDSSMDSEGVENFLDFLSTGFKECYKDKAIYIITHRKEIGEGEFFDSMINLVKKNGFTSVESIVELKN